MAGPPLLMQVSVIIGTPIQPVMEFEEQVNEGKAGLTVNIRCTVSAPAIFIPTTVYNVVGETTVGVPVMLPVKISKAKPAGNAGLIGLKPAPPPLFVQIFGVIAIPTIYFAGFVV